MVKLLSLTQDHDTGIQFIKRDKHVLTITPLEKKAVAV